MEILGSDIINGVPIFKYGIYLLTAVLFGTWIHRLCLPKPIPGTIPYKKQNAKRILGDAPDMLKWRSETKEIWSYIKNLAIELDTPIFQMFMRPFGKPWVILTDFRESQDIQLNRQHEFDRSTYIGEVFGPLLPGNHVWMPSNDTFKAHRHLIRDTMSPSFLEGVVGPSIHASTRQLIELWQVRARLAKERPFDASKDIIRNLVDVIIKATFGFQVNAIKTQAKVVTGLSSVHVPTDVDAAVEFPEAEDPKAYTSVRDLVDSLHIAQNSPVPRQHLTFALKFYPYLAAARKWNEDMMGKRLQLAWKKFSANADRDDQVESAVDLLVQREAQMAQRQNRDVQYDTRVIRDELFGFFAAGHETTSTTICWAVKFLTKHQDVQKRLRSALQKTHKRAFKEGDLPTSMEITRTDVPYLDAFIEENHRLGQAIPAVIRMATRDTVILGHFIPKGTDVFMMMNGPSYQSPALQVSESVRTKGSQESKNKYGVWNDLDIGEFRPERWLSQEENGDVKFNPFAGPALPYGLGLRGCFGIKLAVLELRVIITLLVWSFEMLPTPELLSGFKGDDMNTHRAQQVYLRLKPIG
ncbi:Cytochrome P450 monooxygenase TRI13 [Lachnellula suecica]|uniref:Cytochrome P450 monooxygenase TRI13 n=1 Tax=Lachnellula suecica TaxID=602035 RepID=A0A8T9CCH7_9HELO|nr:Cytochrome P450 monooxygenase TRI13 [Lachnellula suecica]